MKLNQVFGLVCLVAMTFLTTEANSQENRNDGPVLSPAEMQELLDRETADTSVLQASAEQTVREISKRNRIGAKLITPGFFNLLMRMSKSKELELEFTASQLSTLKEINERIEAIKAKANQENRELGNYEMVEIQTLKRSAMDVILDGQFEELVAMFPANGQLLKALNKSQTLRAKLSLTKDQLAAINRKSKKLQEEVDSFLRAKRIEAAEIVANELTHDQNNSLVELFSASYLNNCYFSTPVETFLKNLSFGKDSNTNQSPAEKNQVWPCQK